MVVAIIAILAALLLPALSRAKEAGRKTQCINNQKQMHLIAHFYATDNNDFLVPPNGVVPVGAYNPPAPIIRPWVYPYYGAGGENTSPTFMGNAQYSAFADYNTKLDLYKCPSDRTLILGVPRLRTYSLNWILGTPDPDEGLRGWFRRKTSDLLNPSPANHFAFLDENPNSLASTFFRVHPMLYGFWNLPGSYHNGSTPLSFMDGHVEAHRWIDPRTKLALRPGVASGTELYWDVTIESGGPDPLWLHSKSTPPPNGWLQ